MDFRVESANPNMTSCSGSDEYREPRGYHPGWKWFTDTNSRLVRVGGCQPAFRSVRLDRFWVLCFYADQVIFTRKLVESLFGAGPFAVITE